MQNRADVVVLASSKFALLCDDPSPRVGTRQLCTEEDQRQVPSSLKTKIAPVRTVLEEDRMLLAKDDRGVMLTGIPRDSRRSHFTRGRDLTELDFPDRTLVVIATGEAATSFRIVSGSLDHQTDWSPSDLAANGPAGKTPPELSAQDLNEATFAKQIAERLFKMAHAGEYDDLILVADPTTLGQIRPLLHQEVKDKLMFDQAKTLINSTVDDIERSLSHR